MRHLFCMSNPSKQEFRSIPAIWSDAYKHSSKLLPILKSEGLEDELETLDYGRAHALIHCLEAYLTWQRIQRGDVVLILAENTPIYYALDLALQYLGAINLTVRPDISEENLRRLIDRHRPHSLLLTSYDMYNHYKAIVEPYVTAENGLVLCYTTRYDELAFTDKLVTLEAAIDIGKDYWREHRGTMQPNQHTIQPDTPVTLVYPFESYETAKPKTLTQNDLTQLTFRLREGMPVFEDNEYLLSAAHPAWLLPRAAGFYVALLRREAMVLSPRGLRPPRQMPDAACYYVLAEPTRLADTTNAAARLWTQKKPKSRPKRLTQALAVARERNKRVKKGEKLGIGFGFKFRRIRNKVLKVIYKRHLNHIAAWITFHAETLPASIRTFYRALDIPLYDAPYPHPAPQHLKDMQAKAQKLHPNTGEQTHETAAHPQSTKNSKTAADNRPKK